MNLNQIADRMGLVRTIQETRCPKCGWESAQPDELHRADAARHVSLNPGHVVLVTTTTHETFR